ncbi:diaminopimelate epimerase [Paraburkholderia sp. ZP32-5]|uniref:diaminopimelate epimerase n=1 Tax=Paraburkholderia sp. ZP32-5 TaxID=2883245 RepID=UPI001F1F3F1F|nr:diaminopimelate epimerase [Paraburkholderia sp. ZP32-5]
MEIPFLKMHANGDDFAIVDLRGQENFIDGMLARQLGDRNRGIGFNQLAMLSDCDDAVARLTFWNADGSTLDTCGSATRGVAWKLMRGAGSSSVVVKTNRGLLTCLEENDLISVEMGVPLTEWQDVPISEDIDTLTLPLPGTPSACSMGNPHCTFFVDNLEEIDLEVFGPKFETHLLFPLKTNVHVVQIIDRARIRLRIWERGGGIPLGSGSCSCGAVVNGIRRGLLENAVQVECDGGKVTVRWDGIGSVFLTGPVEPSFEAIWVGVIGPKHIPGNRK